MFKDLLLKKMIRSQLKGVPEAEQDRLIAIILNNPDLFKKIAEEIQAKVKNGQNQTSAAMEVMKAHENELRMIR